MTVSQLKAHLDNIQAYYGDLEIRIDADLFRDTNTRDLTSIRVVELLLDVESINIGIWSHENDKHRVVFYCGNEPKYNIGNN